MLSEGPRMTQAELEEDYARLERDADAGKYPFNRARIRYHLDTIKTLMADRDHLQREFDTHQKMWVESMGRERLLRQVAETQVADLTKRLADRTLEAQHIGNELTEAYRLKDIQFERAEEAERERDEARKDTVRLQDSRDVLFHLKECLSRHLETSAVHVSVEDKAGHPRGWCAIRIPDWEVKQLLDSISAAMQADTGRATRP